MADDVLPADEAAELRRLDEAATDAPWAWEMTGEKDNSWGIGIVEDADGNLIAGCNPTGENEVIEPVCEAIDGNHADAALIVAMRNALPALLDAHAEVESLRATVARLTTAASDVLDDHFSEAGEGLTPEDALRCVADWLETPRFADMSDGEVEHDLRLIARRLEALRAALDATTAEPAALFVPGEFTAHSDARLRWKIECDTLTTTDWQALALAAVDVLPPFGGVEGIPRGGAPFAQALATHSTPGGPLLIADDVCTTGASFETHRAGRDAIGVVAFARGPAPAWVTPLFTLTDATTAERIDPDTEAAG